MRASAAPGPNGSDPRTAVGVIGGGRMGAGIAHAFLLAGARVAVVERDATAAGHARDRILASVAASIERGLAAPEPDALLVTVSWDALTGSDLVVEAVPEQAALKAEALGRAEALVGPGTVLASNTSSLSIDGLAAGLDRPGAFLGMHFFNPVPASTLVEIVVGARTAPTAVTAATAWVAGLGKTPVVVRDSPGFASSRLGVLLGLEAIRMLEDGVATPEDIDTAMTLGYKHPVGPLRLTDIVGLDVRLDIAEHLARELGARFEPPALLRRMVADGLLGRKSGRGFYEWPAPDARTPGLSSGGSPR